MIQRLLSFDDAPPLSGPLRFFLTAPRFPLAAGPASLVLCATIHMAPWSRDEPAHPLLPAMLFIVGFAGSTVCGMLYQGFARKASAFMPGMDSAEAEGFH